MSIKIDKLIRSRRRSVSLEITRNAQLVVRMPKYGSLRDVKRFILEKHSWIEKKLASARERIEKQALKKFADGEEYYYLGEKYKLQITNANKASANKETLPHPSFANATAGKQVRGRLCSYLEFNNGFYLAEGHQAQAKNIFIKWYKRQAKVNIPKRVRWYANLHKYTYRGIKITSASRRWGSCTAKENLNFTWKLMLLPIRIVDYVVAHELAHLKQPNHSKKFWAEVEKMLPDYKERRKWLKKSGEEYVI